MFYEAKDSHINSMLNDWIIINGKVLLIHRVALVLSKDGRSLISKHLLHTAKWTSSNINQTHRKKKVGRPYSLILNCAISLVPSKTAFLCFSPLYLKLPLILSILAHLEVLALMRNLPRNYEGLIHIYIQDQDSDVGG